MANGLIGFCLGYGLCNLINRLMMNAARKRGWVTFHNDGVRRG